MTSFYVRNFLRPPVVFFISILLGSIGALRAFVGLVSRIGEIFIMLGTLEPKSTIPGALLS
jgi:hypothetical protein